MVGDFYENVSKQLSQFCSLLSPLLIHFAFQWFPDRRQVAVKEKKQAGEETDGPPQSQTSQAITRKNS